MSVSNTTTRKLKLMLRLLAVLVAAYGFALAFIIQDANLTYAIAANSLHASAATWQAYVYDLALIVGAVLLWDRGREVSHA